MFINARQKNQSKQLAIASKNEHSPLSCVCVVCCLFVCFRFSEFRFHRVWYLVQV